MGWLSGPGRATSGFIPWGIGDSGAPPQATHLVPFWSAIRHIVDFLSTLPLDGYRLNGDARVPVSAPALLRAINAPQSIGQHSWIGQWAFGLAVHGNSVGYVPDSLFDGNGYPTYVHWLSRNAWTYDEYQGTWWVYGSPVPQANIVHSAWIVPPGKVLGMSPVDHFREFWKAGLSAQEYADVRRGGGVPPTTLKNAAMVLEDEQAEKTSVRAQAAFASGRPFVTGKDWDLTINTAPPNQQKFLEVLQLSANQTAAIFGIDPREIGGSATESLTYATDESRALNRANNLRPYVERFDYMTSRLLPPNQFMKLNVDATIRTDISTRIAIVGQQIADGRMSVNEARALEDRSPVPGGDYYNVPTPAKPAIETKG